MLWFVDPSDPGKSSRDDAHDACALNVILEQRFGLPLKCLSDLPPLTGPSSILVNGGSKMATKRHKPEEIVAKLCTYCQHSTHSQTTF